MNPHPLTFLPSFARDEDGSSTVEAVIFTTVLMVIFLASIELGIINLRQALLERAVAVSVRDIRLSTGHDPDYEQIRQSICDQMAITTNCEANMMLEMKVVDARSFAALPERADCINAEEEPRPSRQFEPGLDNDLMLMRACFKYKPLFPSTKLAGQLSMDQFGYAQLTARAMFVQEPR